MQTEVPSRHHLGAIRVSANRTSGSPVEPRRSDQLFLRRGVTVHHRRQDGSEDLVPAVDGRDAPHIRARLLPLRARVARRSMIVQARMRSA